jgi:serine O-acetyltransferase
MGVDIAYRDYGDLVLPHPLGVVLHGGMKLGRRVTIYQNVTVASHPRINEAATLEDDVVLCAGCVIVGPVTIGARSIVAANAVVTKDVPPDTTVVGIPAKPVTSSRFVE